MDESSLEHWNQSEAPASQASRVRMETLELASPIATLRSLGALDATGGKDFPPYDPIAHGVLSIHEAQDAIDIYFDNCHPWAPILSEEIRSTGMGLRESSPALFLSLVSVGCRFWRGDSPHAQYYQLTELLDKAILRLVLRSTPHDASLDSIRAIMLYLQWMPFSAKELARPAQAEGAPGTKFKNRYNDMSAWTVFGLALRYASFINLEQLALAPFRLAATSAISRDDIDRMRVWCNIVTYDCNLTFTSGLPVSVNLLPVSHVARKFCSHGSAQEPGDVRYAALVELGCIVLRAKKPDGDSAANRHPSGPNLKRANMEMNEWERHWLGRLRQTKLQYTQLPFTSLRWYRLSLNSAVLRPLLSFSTRSRNDPFPEWAFDFLETSLTAASQILLSLAVGADQFVWGLNVRNTSSYPSGPFIVDSAARFSLHHAVDATWISHTFAMTFLVLCYIRNTIDDDLRVISHPAPNGSIICAPSKPRPDSILARTCRLAVDVFEGESQWPELRPEGGYTSIIRDAASLVLDSAQEELTQITQDPLDPAIQSLFDLMEDTVLDWSSLGYDAGFNVT